MDLLHKNLIFYIIFTTTIINTHFIYIPFFKTLSLYQKAIKIAISPILYNTTNYT